MPTHKMQLDVLIFICCLFGIVILDECHPLNDPCDQATSYCVSDAMGQATCNCLCEYERAFNSTECIKEPGILVTTILSHLNYFVAFQHHFGLFTYLNFLYHKNMLVPTSSFQLRQLNNSLILPTENQLMALKAQVCRDQLSNLKTYF